MQNIPQNSLFVPDYWRGADNVLRPCCYLPHIPERLRGTLLPDLQGMGIPAEGLPRYLRPLSIAGWTLQYHPVFKRLWPVKASQRARQHEGCLAYLKANYGYIQQSFEFLQKDKT